MNSIIQNEDEYRAKMAKLGPLPDDMRIFYAGADLARIEARTTYTLQCIQEGMDITAALDDMAQIIGWRAPLVDDSEGEIIDALMDNAACLVRPTAGAKGGAGAAGFDAAKERIERAEKGEREALITGESKSIWDRGYVVTTGRDPYEAYVALTVLEKAAEVQLKAKALGGVKPLEKGNAKGQRINYLHNYSAAGIKRRKESSWSLKDLLGGEGHPKNSNEEIARDIIDGISESEVADELLREFTARGDLVEYSNKLIEKGLVQGTWGNLSIRLGEDLMLTTPSGLDYDLCGPEDMVRVDIETLKFGEKLEQSKLTEDARSEFNNTPDENIPTTEKGLHAAIYLNRPEVGAIIHTHSKFCSVFAAAKMPLEISEPELAKTLGDVLNIADYAGAGTDRLADNVVKALGNRPGCIMSNHGMIACGSTIEEAFETALAMEDAARREINKRL